MGKSKTAPATAPAAKSGGKTPAQQAAELNQKPAAAPAPAPAAKKEEVKTRGPRGVVESAKITLLAKSNPKREGSNAHKVFSHYKDGMTVGEFCDAVGAPATPNLVYDSKHGFISIEGYDPGEIIKPKEKAPPKPKAEKKGAPTDAEKAAVAKKDAAVKDDAKEEVMS